MKLPYEEFDLSGVRTYPLASRASKANAADFARRMCRAAGCAAGSSRCPRSSPARISGRWPTRSARAHDGGRAVMWGLGAHVIKTGLGPVLIDLMARGFVSALATNGAAVIHDFELALSGSTSEDVDEALGPGRFGMADETGRLLNAAINDGVAPASGIGQAVGAWLRDAHPPLRAPQHRRRGRPSADPGHRSCRHRHRHHSHAPGGVRRRARRRQPARLSLPDLERRATSRTASS